METLMGLLPFIAMFAVMWFILIRPAQKRAKETANMQNALKRGDKVVTVGGLHGEVDAIEDTVVHIRVDEKTILIFERQAIGRVIAEEKNRV
jgi:preprotein translocase subunit YajC